jgi:hypothetical protein
LSTLPLSFKDWAWMVVKVSVINKVKSNLRCRIILGDFRQR